MACSPVGRFVKLILMVTPVPPLTSAMTAVPTLPPFASFKDTVTGLVAAEAVASSQEPVARMQRARNVYVNMETVYKTLPATALVRLMDCMFRFETAGESHGECLVATVTGMPAGIPVSLAAIDRELWRRQQGFGRGGRMKIETDRAHIVSGVRHSKTIGSPIAIIIENKDWKNWMDVLPVEGNGGERKAVTRPRPGHADLAGAIKYDFQDARYILERASARETTARVAVGALAKALLGELGIQVLSHVIAVGEERLHRAAEWEELVALSQRDEVLLACVDAEAEQRMKGVVDEAYRTGDTVGGVFEVVAHGVPA